MSKRNRRLRREIMATPHRPVEDTARSMLDRYPSAKAALDQCRSYQVAIKSVPSEVAYWNEVYIEMVLITRNEKALYVAGSESFTLDQIAAIGRVHGEDNEQFFSPFVWAGSKHTRHEEITKLAVKAYKDGYKLGCDNRNRCEKKVADWQAAADKAREEMKAKTIHGVQDDGNTFCRARPVIMAGVAYESAGAFWGESLNLDEVTCKDCLEMAKRKVIHAMAVTGYPFCGAREGSAVQPIGNLDTINCPKCCEILEDAVSEQYCV